MLSALMDLICSRAGQEKCEHRHAMALKMHKRVEINGKPSGDGGCPQQPKHTIYAANERSNPIAQGIRIKMYKETHVHGDADVDESDGDGSGMKSMSLMSMVRDGFCAAGLAGVLNSMLVAGKAWTP